MEERRRQQIERENLAAEQGFGGEGQDHKALDFQEPKREQAEAVGDGELDQRGEHERGPEQEQPPGLTRESQVRPKQGIDGQQRHEDEHTGNGARGEEHSKAVDIVIDGLEEKLVDQPVPDFLADLVVFVEGANDELQGDQRGEVGEGLPDRVAADLREAGVGRAPEDEHHRQAGEGEEAADEKVPPVDQIALQADEEDVAVFGQDVHRLWV